MNIYVINEVLYDYTPGMVVIAASDLSECRAIFQQDFASFLEEFDSAIKDDCYKVIPAGDGVEAGTISHVYGGG